MERKSMCALLSLANSFASCFTLGSYSAYFSSMKMEANVPPTPWLTFDGLHIVVSPKIEPLD
jgi:hypothetical protein